MRNYLAFIVFISLLASHSVSTAAPLNNVLLKDLAGKSIPNVILEMNAQPLVAVPMQDEYIMDQVDFKFVPEVLLIPKNALVRFPNSDDSRHHVYSFSQTKQFELKLFSGNQAPPVQFENAGAVAVGCNIHDRMNGYIYITDYPIAVKSNAKGVVAVPNYEAQPTQTFQVWHPLLLQPLQFNLADIDIDANGSATLSLPIALPEEDNATPINSLKSRLKSYKSNGN